MLIEEGEPDTWEDLEDCVTRILNEAGLQAERGKSITTARGSVNVDVFASDDVVVPPALTIFECKYWKDPVPQTVIHAFRTVVIDSGANAGFIVSRRGFQSGAEAAANFSNIRLLDWFKFQELYAERWIRTYMAKQVSSVLDSLLEYVEPVNSRIFRKADELPEPRRQEFRRLRQAYSTGVTLLAIMFSDVPMPITRTGPLPLPLRQAIPNEDTGSILPDSLLDASSLRVLMQAIINYAESATRNFDAVFGGRA